MAKKVRPKTAVPVSSEAAKSPPVQPRGGDLSRSTLALAVVGLLIACYLVLFYSAHGFRLRSLMLVFAPDALWANWTANGEYPLSLVDRLPLILIACGIVAVAWAGGGLVIRGWRLDERLSRLETHLFSIGVGLSLWSTWALAVGLFGMLHQMWLVWLPAIPTALLAGFQMAARREPASHSSGSSAAAEDSANRWLLSLAIPFVLLYLLAAVLPATDFDVREYHLQVPKEWYQAGRITFMPHNVYGNMPLGAEMFALLGMTLIPGADGWWYGALVGKVVMAITALLTALLLYAAGRRIGSTTAGVVAGLVYLSTPWVYVVSVSGRNEGTLALYLALAVYAVWLWRSEATPRTLGWLILAGFFAGSAAAVKYTAIPLLCVPLLVAVIALERRFDWRSGLVFFAAAVAAGGLWHGKNLALAGNPVYPLAGQILGGATRTPEKITQWNSAHRTPPLSETGIEAGRILLRSEWLSPLLVPLAALAWVNAKYRRHALWIAALLAYYFACWLLFTHRLDRFWVPALVLVAALAGLGATWSRLGAWRHVLTALLFWGLVANFLQMNYLNESTDAEENLPINFLFVSLDALRDATTPPAHRYLNEDTPRGYSALLVGDAAPLDLKVPTLYNTCFDDVWYDTFIKDRTRDERLAALREQKIAYIYVSWSDIHRYRSPGNYGFSDYITRKKLYEELVQEQKLLRKVPLKGVQDTTGELFEVLGVVPRPE